MENKLNGAVDELRVPDDVRRQTELVWSVRRKLRNGGENLGFPPGRELPVLSGCPENRQIRLKFKFVT